MMKRLPKQNLPRIGFPLCPRSLCSKSLCLCLCLPVPVPVLVPAAAWTRAVEKLRHRQADLNLRAEQTQKESWNSRFDKAWQRLAPDYPRSAQTHGANQRLRRRSWSPQASARIVIPRRRPVIEAPVIESSPEQIQDLTSSGTVFCRGNCRPRFRMDLHSRRCRSQ